MYDLTGMRSRSKAGNIVVGFAVNSKITRGPARSRRAGPVR